MMRPEAATSSICATPRLCMARLHDLRAHLDALLGSEPGESSPREGADHASSPPSTTRTVRGAARPATNPSRTPPGHDRDPGSAADGGNCSPGPGFDREGGAS
jgi:hypothetical protein